MENKTQSTNSQKLNRNRFSNGLRVLGVAALLGALFCATPLQAADALIGRWIGGAASLTNYSTYTPVGKHDGVAVGASAGSLAWSADVPAGFTGNSLDLTANLTANTVGVLITNTATDDSSYTNTFDEGISNRFTAAFWFKAATPGTSATNGNSGVWFGKSGNTPNGWKSRPLNGVFNADFTMRNNSGESVASALFSSNTVSDGAWHHVACVFDGTASFRKIYVDGVIQKQTTGTPYGVSLAPGSHLVFGCNQGTAAGSAINSFFPGKMYDVRIYNYALTDVGVLQIFTPGGLASSKEITSFIFPGLGNATIVGTNISITVPFSTVVTGLAPTYADTGVSRTPASGTARNFTTPQTYTITAQDTSTNAYRVTVTKAPISTANDMLSLTWGAYSSSIVGTNVTLYVPPGTALVAINPTITVSPFATVSPLSGTAHDFTTPVSYTVTAENGIATKTYLVAVGQANFWTNNAGGGWATAANWDPNAVPTSGTNTILNFKAAGTYTSTDDTGAGFQLNQIVLGAPALTLDGDGLQFAGTTPTIVQSSAAAVTIGNFLTLVANTTIGGSGAGAVTLNGAVSGGALTKTTSGTLTLGVGNSYSGGTFVNNGTLSVGANTALGSGTVTLAGGVTMQTVNFEGFGLNGNLANNFVLSGGLVNLNIPFNANKDIWISGVVSGSGGFHIQGFLRGVTLSGDNTFSGGVTVDAGSIGIGVSQVNGLGVGALSLGAGAGAALNYAGDHVVTSLTLNGVVQPKGTYGSAASGATTVDSHFSGTGTVTVGPKMLTFDFGVYGPGVITGTNITVTVPFGTVVTGLAPTFTASYAATGTPVSGTVRNFTSPQIYTLFSGDAVISNAYQVTVSIAANTTPIIFTWINPASSNWSDASSWTTDAGLGFAPLPAGQSNYVFNFNQAGTYTATQDQSVGFVLNQLNFGGSAVTLAGNDLALTSNNAASPRVSQNSAAAVTVSNNLDLGANTILGGSGGGAVTISGMVTGVGSLTKTNAGTLTLNGANTYIGGTIISNGTLSVGDRTALGSGTVTLAGGSTMQTVNFEGFLHDGNPGNLANDFVLSGGLVNLYLAFNATKDMLITGVVSGPGGFRLQGFLRGLNLSGDNTFSGGVTLDAGPIGVTASHVNGLGVGALSIGSGASANLAYTGDHVVTSLTLNGVVQPNGTYGSANSPADVIDNAHFSGTGTVTVGPHHQAKILTFVFSGFPATTIDQTNHTVRVTVPTGTDVTLLSPTYTISAAATSAPGSGATFNFTTPQSYTVRSEDGAVTNVYVVTVTVTSPPVVTVTSITGPVASEFTIHGSTDIAGNVVTEKTASLSAPIIWVPFQTNAVPGGIFGIVVPQGVGTQAFYRLVGQ